ncbi:phage tail tape measure protein [Metaclostridioides mangenotii]|uniref:TP901 family phage tail tape measure protein n=1 Tax=Metaclostridioides mangenotii TaxID=1540 RepID=A0ABS4E705_9FIRM|nr:phage tail tape measure protein [Clostridioides mangenotii]MBP1853721.1 TP901 family phage tail tape measure protein [Clostridioides mangenotii]
MANPEIKVQYTLVNKQFNSEISSINKAISTLNKSFAVQREQMKNTSTDTQKLEAEISKLEKQYELAKQKTEATAQAFENAKRTMGENSEEARKWGDKLLVAQKNEEQLKNAITETNVKLEDAKQKQSQLTAEQQRANEISEQRKNKLKELKSEEEQLKNTSEKLSKEYELQVKSLGNNASASDQLKARQEYLQKAMENSAKQVENLEKQLELAKSEYGESSEEVNKLEQELLDARIAAQDFANEYADAGNKVKQASDKLLAAGDKLKGVGKTLTTHVSLPLVALGGGAIKAASDFDSAFTGVKKTVDEVVDANGKTIISYKDLEKGIRDMAKEIPASTTEISAVAEAAGQLGIETENVLGFTRVMVDMGVATNLSSEEAAMSLAKLAAITDMPQKSFSNLASSIVALGNDSKTTEADIVAMSLRLAGTGKQANMSEADIIGISAAMSSLGINAEAGGGSMSRVMQKINSDVMSGGGNLEKFAKTAGMSSSEFQKAWKEDAAGALVEFVKGLGKAKESGEDVTGALKKMGITSTQEVDTMLRLSGAGELLSKSLKTSADGWKENTALTEEAEKRYESFEGQLKTLKNKLMDIAVDIGGPLMEAMNKAFDAAQPFLQVIADLAKKFAEASPETQKLILVIGGIVIAIGPVLTVIGSLLGVLGTLTGAWAVAFKGATAVTPAINGLSKVF